MCYRDNCTGWFIVEYLWLLEINLYWRFMMDPLRRHKKLKLQWISVTLLINNLRVQPGSLWTCSWLERCWNLHFIMLYVPLSNCTAYFASRHGPVNMMQSRIYWLYNLDDHDSMECMCNHWWQFKNSVKWLQSWPAGKTGCKWYGWLVSGKPTATNPICITKESIRT